MTGEKVELEIKDIKDFRNYKVTCEKARTTLGFRPKYSVEAMIEDLYKHMEVYGDFTDPNFYNIQVFKELQVDKISS